MHFLVVLHSKQLDLLEVDVIISLAGLRVFLNMLFQDQIDILVAAILNGDNVRVGTEDYPFNRQGKLCTTHELVKEIADISRSLGREVATPDQARELLGL